MFTLQKTKIDTGHSDYDVLLKSPKSDSSFASSVLQTLLAEDLKSFKNSFLLSSDNSPVLVQLKEHVTQGTTSGCRTRGGCKGDF